MKAEKLLADIRTIYNKNSCIEIKKTAEQLLEKGLEKKSNNDTSLIQTEDKPKPLILNDNKLTDSEELIITKCLSAWYNTSKEEMITSLVDIIKENPKSILITRIITDLVNRLSDDPREQRIQQMGSYRDMLFSDYIEEWLTAVQKQVAATTYKRIS